MYKLLEETVVVGSETLTVSQASNAMDIDRSSRISEALKSWPDDATDTKDQKVQYMETLLYPSLISCTSGNLPTFDEFMSLVSIEDSVRWTQVAKKLNPRWFTFIEDSEVSLAENAEEKLEKKEE